MPVIRITCALLGFVAFIATMLAASDSSVRNMFLLIILSLGTAVIWTIPDLVAAILPENTSTNAKPSAAWTATCAASIA